MNIYVEWKDYFGDDRAIPIVLDGEDPTFADLFTVIQQEAGLEIDLFKVIYSNFDVTAIDGFSVDQPLSWIGIGPHSTLKLESKTALENEIKAIPETDMSHVSPRFDVHDMDAYEYLKEHGYVVIQNVLNSEEISTAENMCWKWIESTTDGEVLRNDIESWNSKSWPADRDNGLIQEPSVGQADWLWYVRGKPKVKQAFSYIWNTDELGVSFDTGNLFRPYGYKEEWKTKGGWFHVDQNSKLLPGKCCVQGMVSFKAATKETGGLCVIPKSHFRHDEFCERNAAGGHFLPIHERDPIRQMQSVLVSCEAGDLVLWDSRTVHCNTPGCGSLVKDDVIRMNAYVCMQPISMCSEEVEQKRKNAYDRHITTSHWVSIYSEPHVGGPEKFVPHSRPLSSSEQNLIWPQPVDDEYQCVIL